MKFSLYDLILDTELPLGVSGLPEIDTHKSNIRISVKASLNKIPNKLYKLNKKKSSVYLRGIAEFHIEDGESILIFPHEKIDLKKLVFSVLNFPLAVCMAQRGYIALHASTVKKKDHTILFCGASHSGKSTLAYAFKQEGWKILTEDICIIDPNSKKVLSSHPSIKLSKEASYFFGLSNEKAEISKKRIRSNYVISNQKFMKSNIDYCFFLNWNEKGSIKSLSNEEIISEIQKYSFAASKKDNSIHIMQLIKNIKFKKLNITKDFSKIFQVVDLVENFARKKN